MDVDDVVDALDTDAEAGLDARESVRRLEQHGPNELVPDEPRGTLDLLVSQFTSPLIYILVVAAVVTIAIQEYADAAVIAAVLVINATVGFVQERRADRSVHALQQLAAPSATVVRDGRQAAVEPSEVVPGDVLVLEAGTRVAADARLTQATQLKADESMLTGESEPVDKSTEVVEEDALPADRAGMVHMGTSVSSGSGRGVVVATAEETELGTISEQIRTAEKPETPLQQRMDRFANVIALVVLGGSVVTLVLGLALGEPLTEMFLTAVALAVAVVPEGLPVAFTVAMALGVRRMAARNALIRQLPAVETLGSTDVIGSDKTGTLTTNHMTVLRAWTPAEGLFTIRRGGEDPLGEGDELPTAADRLDEAPDGALAHTIRSGALSNAGSMLQTNTNAVGESTGDADQGQAGSIDDAGAGAAAGSEDGDDDAENEDAEGEAAPRAEGDPTDVALLELALDLGLEPDELREQAHTLATVPFDASRAYSYVVVDEDGPVLRLKGAPETVLDLCSVALGADGVVDLDVEAVREANEDLARRGLRVLAMAQRDVGDADVDADDPPPPENLIFTGLVGMQDPPRPGVEDSVRRCREAGIDVAMITGDHVTTARAIARALNIVEEEDAPVLTGADLADLDDEDLVEKARGVRVFARTSPEQKLKIVHALQHEGSVVAVTGDGVNDAPALKAADIGVAMGRGGTDVAREASAMVLTDDDFSSIAAAVEEGRGVFDNVRKVTYYLVSTGIAVIAAVLYSIVAGLPLPFMPAALLWLNVVTNGADDVAMAFEPVEPDVLEQPPRPREEPVVSGRLWERAVLIGLTMAVGSMWLFHWAIGAGLSEGEQRGAALAALVVAMGIHAFNSRSERRSIVRTHVKGNRFLVLAVLGGVSVHVLATYWRPTQSLLRVEPVIAAGWPRIFVVAVLVVLVSEAHKALRRG